jgi:hypothetical protein
MQNSFWFEKPANDYCNDCVTHAFNYAFKHPILVSREQVHRLAGERDRKGADYTMQRVKNGGYSLKMFNSFVVKEDKTYNFELYMQLTLWVELEDTVKAFFQTGLGTTLLLVGSYKGESYNEQINTMQIDTATHACTFLAHRGKSGKIQTLCLDSGCEFP